jgi:hypothetical protein
MQEWLTGKETSNCAQRKSPASALWLGLVGPVILSAYTAYGYGTECSETLAYKLQTPANHPEENIQNYLPVFISDACFIWTKSSPK